MTSSHPPSSLILEGVGVRRGGRLIVSDVSINVGPGLHHVRGANGAGKSTLFRAIAGALPASAGTIAVCGFDIEKDSEQARKKIGWLPDGASLFLDICGGDLVETVAILRGTDHREYCSYVEALGLTSAWGHRLGTLSYGQRRKFALLSAIVGDPAVLLLDEPEDGLDATSLRFVREYLHARKHCTRYCGRRIRTRNLQFPQR